MLATQSSNKGNTINSKKIHKSSSFNKDFIDFEDKENEDNLAKEDTKKNKTTHSRLRNRFWGLFTQAPEKSEEEEQPSIEESDEEILSGIIDINSPVSLFQNIVHPSSSPIRSATSKDITKFPSESTDLTHGNYKANQPLSRMLVGRKRLPGFQLQLESLKLNYGNEFPLLHCWSLSIHFKLSKEYKKIYEELTDINGLERTILMFKNSVQEKKLDDSVVILLKRYYKIKTPGSIALAFQITEGDEYLTFKTIARLICEENIGYSLGKEDLIDIYGLSFSEEVGYGLLKIYMIEIPEEMVNSFVMEIIKPRLTKECQYLCETMRIIRN